jgi:hypothetical protein
MMLSGGSACLILIPMNRLRRLRRRPLLSFRIFSDRTRLFGTLLSHARIGINVKDPEIIDTLMAYDFVAIAIMDLASAGTRPTRRKVTE